MPQKYLIPGPDGKPLTDRDGKPISFNHEPTDQEYDDAVKTANFTWRDFDPMKATGNVRQEVIGALQGAVDMAKALPGAISTVMSPSGSAGVASQLVEDKTLQNIPRNIAEYYGGYLNPDELAWRMQEHPVGTVLDVGGAVSGVAGLQRTGANVLENVVGKGLYHGGAKLAAVGHPRTRAVATALGEAEQIPLSYLGSEKARGLSGARSAAAGDIVAQTRTPLTVEDLAGNVDPEAVNQVTDALSSPGKLAEQSGVSRTMQSVLEHGPMAAGEPPTPGPVGANAQKLKKYLQKRAKGSFEDVAAGVYKPGETALYRNMSKGAQKRLEDIVEAELGPTALAQLKKLNTEAGLFRELQEAGIEVANSRGPAGRGATTAGRMMAGTPTAAGMASGVRTGLGAILASSPEYLTRAGIGFAKQGQGLRGAGVGAMNPTVRNSLLVQEALRLMFDEEDGGR